MGLYTRREVIAIWLGGNFLDFYCCPDCRDILTKRTHGDSVYYICANIACVNGFVYDECEIDK